MYKLAFESINYFAVKYLCSDELELLKNGSSYTQSHL